MEFLYAFLFALVLSVDSFSAAFALGLRKHKGSDVMRVGLLSGVSEGILAAFGFFFGKIIIAKISAYDHWIAFGLLFYIGAHMIFEAFKKQRTPQKQNSETEKFHSFRRVLTVSLATSVDALGVGMGLGVAGKPWLLYSSLIALGAFFSTLIGMQLARKLSSDLGPKFEIVGGLVLMALAFPMLRI